MTRRGGSTRREGSERRGGSTRRARAGEAFAIFAEALLVGVVVGVASLPLVTMPAALAAGIGHLRRFVRGEGSPWRQVWLDFRRALLGGIGVGVGVCAVIVAALFTIGLAASDRTPVGGIMVVAGMLGIAIAATALLLLAGSWTSEAGWWLTVTRLRNTVDSDPVAVVYLLVAVGLVAVITWQFFVLLFPAVGLAAFATVAIQERRRRPADE